MTRSTHCSSGSSIKRHRTALQPARSGRRPSPTGPLHWQYGIAGTAIPLATGGDVAVFHDGRIRHLYAFFDKA